MLLSSGTTCDASLANSTQNKRNNVHLKAKRGATGGRWEGGGGGGGGGSLKKRLSS